MELTKRKIRDKVLGITGPSLKAICNFRINFAVLGIEEAFYFLIWNFSKKVWIMSTQPKSLIKLVPEWWSLDALRLQGEVCSSILPRRSCQITPAEGRRKGVWDDIDCVQIVRIGFRQRASFRPAHQLPPFPDAAVRRTAKIGALHLSVHRLRPREAQHSRFDAPLWWEKTAMLCVFYWQASKMLIKTTVLWL